MKFIGCKVFAIAYSIELFQNRRVSSANLWERDLCMFVLLPVYCYDATSSSTHKSGFFLNFLFISHFACLVHFTRTKPPNKGANK